MLLLSLPIFLVEFLGKVFLYKEKEKEKKKKERKSSMRTSKGKETRKLKSKTKHSLALCNRDSHAGLFLANIKTPQARFICWRWSTWNKQPVSSLRNCHRPRKQSATREGKKWWEECKDHNTNRNSEARQSRGVWRILTSLRETCREKASSFQGNNFSLNALQGLGLGVDPWHKATAFQAAVL